MTDREKLGLCGPVHAVSTEMFEFVREGEQFTPRPWYRTTATFNRDGSTASHISTNPDGSVSRSWFQYDERGRLHQIQFQLNDGPARTTVHEYDAVGRLVLVDTGGPGSRSIRYDADGRRIESQLVPRQPGAAFSFGIEGSRSSYSCEGAHEVTTVYDAAGRASEMLFHDHAGKLLSRVALTWDTAGRLVEEAQLLGEMSVVEVPAGAEVSAADRAAIERAFGAGAEQSRRVHLYDAQNRCVETVLYLASTFHDRDTYSYDDHGSKTEETHYDDSGRLTHQVRYEREYDPRGNWTVERVLTRNSEIAAFTPVNLSRRTIAHYS